MIYRKKNAPLLTSDEPATVNVQGEDFDLEPLDHKEEPPTMRMFVKATGLMHENKDWNNLIPLLEGLHQANRRIDIETKEKIVRWLGEDGQHSIIIRLFQRVEATKMILSEAEMAHKALLAAIDMGLSTMGWGAAAKYADTVWEMIWERRHQGANLNFVKPQEKILNIGLMVLVHSMSGNEAETQDFCSALMEFWWQRPKFARESKQYRRILLYYSPLLTAMQKAETLCKNDEVTRNFCKNAQADLRSSLQQAIKTRESLGTPDDDDPAWKVFLDMERLRKESTAAY